MTIYADTSVLVSLYTPDANSESAAHLMRRAKLPVVFTDLGELELTNALHLRIFRKELSSTEIKAAFAMFRQDLAAGILSLQSLPPSTFQRALRLSRKHSAQLGVRSLDVLHVASALSLQVDELYTFDHAQRRLAKAEGLTIS